MNVGQGLVCVILSIYYRENWVFEVPVIVLWTKTDSLDVAKFKQLMKEGISKSEARQQAPQKAWADYESNIYQLFDRFKYPPKAYICCISKWVLHFCF